MAMNHSNHMPLWTVSAPAAACALLALKSLSIVPADTKFGLILAAGLLGATVFAAVHHAEVVALKIGEPFGSILLAAAVTVIETALIISIMLSGAAGADHVARDAIFAAVMIVLNGVVGLCLVLGGQRHFEQTFQLQGASSALSVLGTLAVLALILPNYTVAVPGPYYSPAQLILVSVMSAGLWFIFVFVQTVRHRDYFLDPPDDPPDAGVEPPLDGEEGAAHEPPSPALTSISVALLLVSLAAVVLLAKMLSHPADTAIAAAGLPKAFVGVVIAAIVLLPEGLSAVKSALRNQLQNSINLSLGSAIASIGLTIPTVAIVSLMLHQKLVLGISPSEVTLLMLTLFISTITLGTGRTTVLQGAIHLVIFAVFILISAVP